MDIDQLDRLYLAWMAAEADERAALILLGARDDVEMRALSERVTERRDEAERLYRDALEESRTEAASSAHSAANSL